jgi:hypothetical protein
MGVELTLSAVCVPSVDVVAREIEGDVIIVPLVAGIGDADDELYTLNETGHAIWRYLDGERTLDAIVQLLCDEFDAPTSTVEKDVLGFASEMVRRGILAAK